MLRRVAASILALPLFYLYKTADADRVFFTNVITSESQIQSGGHDHLTIELDSGAATMSADTYSKHTDMMPVTENNYPY